MHILIDKALEVCVYVTRGKSVNRNLHGHIVLSLTSNKTTIVDYINIYTLKYPIHKGANS